MNWKYALPALDRPLFLYLSERAWVNAWTDGGAIPLSPTSKYKSDQRHQTQTPDEVDQRSGSGFMFNASTKNLAAEKFAADFAEMNGLAGVAFSGGNISFDDGFRSGPLSGSFNTIQEDTLILSLSRFAHTKIARKLDKRALVRIDDPLQLFKSLSDQLNGSGKFEFVEYTSGVQRNTFLKSKSDGWQHEARMSWSVDPCVETWVEVSPNTAKRVDLSDIGNPMRLKAITFLDFDRRDEEELRLFDEINRTGIGIVFNPSRTKIDHNLYFDNALKSLLDIRKTGR